jgi:hypothetical protein
LTVLSFRIDFFFSNFNRNPSWKIKENLQLKMTTFHGEAFLVLKPSNVVFGINSFNSETVEIVNFGQQSSSTQVNYFFSTFYQFCRITQPQSTVIFCIYFKDISFT